MLEASIEKERKGGPLRKEVRHGEVIVDEDFNKYFISAVFTFEELLNSSQPTRLKPMLIGTEDGEDETDDRNITIMMKNIKHS